MLSKRYGYTWNTSNLTSYSEKEISKQPSVCYLSTLSNSHQIIKFPFSFKHHLDMFSWYLRLLEDAHAVPMACNNFGSSTLKTLLSTSCTTASSHLLRGYSMGDGTLYCPWIHKQSNVVCNRISFSFTRHTSDKLLKFRRLRIRTFSIYL